MNLPETTSGLADERENASAKAGFFRQIQNHGLVSTRLKMQILERAGNLANLFVVAAFGLMLSRASAQTNYYSPNGGEYAIIGSLPGDQVTPAAAINTNGGYLVWADNITDGSGWGISARKLDSTLSGTLGTFRVNVTGAGDQQNPKVALLQNGGAVFVWQGGQQGFQHIYAGFLNSSGVFIGSSDILVNSSTNYFQANPSVAVLTNGNVVVTYSSFNQAGTGSMQDVYAQILTSSGAKSGSEFLVNQFTAFNQRSPVVAAQPNGGFVVAWVSEQERIVAPNLGTNSALSSASALGLPSVDIYARYFNSFGNPLGNEFLVNTDNNPCANPVVAVAADGSFLVSWTARDMSNPYNSLDVYARAFNSSGTPGSVFYVNSTLYGDQYLPQVSAIGLDYLVTWTSLGQDGSREGVYGRYIHNNGAYNSGEFLVNTTTLSQQMDSYVASDGKSQFLVIWRSFTGLTYGFDLYAQRYLNMQVGLPAMSAPYVWAPFVVSNSVYQPTLVVSWAPLLGLNISNYEVYVDGAIQPLPTGVTTSNQWVMTPANGLLTNSLHSFQVDYVTTSGARPPLSPATSGTTWGGQNWYGVPFEWMTTYYGPFSVNLVNNIPVFSWPANYVPGTSTTFLSVFKSGGNPLNPATWLKQTLTKTTQGLFLGWNTTPGATYQVQQTTNFSTWNNVGSPRFAAGTSDSIYVGGSSVGYYQILLLR